MSLASTPYTYIPLLPSERGSPHHAITEQQITEEEGWAVEQLTENQ